MNIKNIKKLLLPLISIVVLSFTLNSCNKKDQEDPEESMQQLSNEDIFFKWGQSRNGRWLPYVLKKINKEYPNLKKGEMLGVLNSYLRPINEANEFYANSAAKGELSTADKIQLALDVYYKKEYHNINNSLKEIKTMDAIYEQYKELQIRNKIRKTSAVRKLSFTDLDGVTIFACSITEELKIFVYNTFGPNAFRDGVISWNPDPRVSPVCAGFLMQMRDAVIEFAQNSRVGSPSEGLCRMWVDEIERSWHDYGACQTLFPDTPIESPEDPYPPEGGEGSISLPDLDVSGLDNYPKFKALVVDLPNFLKKYPNILKALSYTTGFTEAKITELMQPGKGPKVVVVQNLKDSKGRDVLGHFDEQTKTLQIDDGYVNGIDIVQSPIRYQAIGLILTVTTLHEFVHFGRDVNMLANKIEVGSHKYEAGWYFEGAIAPDGVGQLGPDTAVEWLNYYTVKSK
ncbi:hypothetical protein [Pedobacter sp. MC2016-24]|uniref:hypothetical protein n=1 Tax=Pedobacter sp. MC2016-24 TaxID=2780090 RepID=UPI00187F40E1|nr:hypothetical protein [Pedobacter sp. MC2016-24]MBE9603148.1 hypothetical protein [Pedobacter sp. MC2016-24]